MTEQAATQPDKTWWDRSYPLHPFLFALASVLALMASSLNQVNFGHTAGTLIGVSIFASVLYLAVAVVRRRFDARTAVVASIWIGGSLFYLGLFGALNQLLGGGYSMLHSLPIAFVVLLLLTVLATKLPAPAVSIANTVLNAIAVVMFVTPAWQAGAYEWHNGSARSVYDAERAALALPPAAAADQSSRPPDIYHFVFDRYASAETLEEYFDFDDGETTSFLEARGFRVVGDGRSNYHRTAHSLASTFYMDYLDVLADAPNLAGDNWQAVHAMLGDHRVARFLNAQGYDFFQFGSWWTGTFRNPAANLNRPHGYSEFNMLYLRRTILRPIFHALPDWPWAMRLDWDNAQCQRVAAQIEEIKEIGERESPTYVFAHILVPHGPYNFAADGSCLTMEESGRRGSRQGYLDQISYAGRMIEDLVTHLQAQGRERPVILIQSDEGPFPAFEAGVPWQDQQETPLRIKTGILNAYYFPDGDYAALNDSMTPVNSYRVLFNTLFRTDFEILPDRVFVFPDDDNLYDFHDVTDLVRR